MDCIFGLFQSRLKQLVYFELEASLKTWWFCFVLYCFYLVAYEGLFMSSRSSSQSCSLQLAPTLLVLNPWYFQQTLNLLIPMASPVIPLNQHSKTCAWRGIENQDFLSKSPSGDWLWVQGIILFIPLNPDSYYSSTSADSLAQTSMMRMF